MRFFLGLWVCLFHVQAAWSQDRSSDKPAFMQWTENIQIDPDLWAEALEKVREKLSKKRSGNKHANNNDIYDLSWLNDINAENLEFQSYAIWIDLSIGAKFKDRNRGLDNVLARLQSDTSIQATEAFLEQHCYTLSDMEKNCGVEAPFIGGIVSIESFFGSYEGVVKFPTVATLASWIALLDQDFRNHVLQQYYTAIDLNHGFANNLTDKTFVKGSKFVSKSIWISRAKRRGEKSIVQLRDLMNIAQDKDWSTTTFITIEGSWVGAFTPVQFMPSTLRGILTEDDAFDPNNLDDMIPLAGRYLSKSWGESEARKDFAIKTYNSPTWYREHVMTIAKAVYERWQELSKEDQN
ncbi:lytic murein transglycosylase [bacterium]|nr:lytic murein transglycosylase [bacterium]